MSDLKIMAYLEENSVSGMALLLLILPITRALDFILAPAGESYAMVTSLLSHVHGRVGGFSVSCMNIVTGIVCAGALTQIHFKDVLCSLTTS